ncbi:MAG: hypothetical protein SGJ10_09410 [Bacteroidota bacterium]|nr:hypothetical protein [Bacteroidota bacterium]
MGYDTIVISVGDDNTFNNYEWHQYINAKEYSYADWTKSSNGGFSFSGFGATGDVRTRFTGNRGGTINKVKLSFTTNNVNCKVGIWDMDTTTGLPYSSPLYLTPSNVKTGSNVTVLPKPAPSIVASGPKTLCQGGQVTLKVSSAISLSNIQWRKAGVDITGANLDSLIVNVAGDYEVFVKSTNGCSDSSTVTKVTITSSPAPQVSATGSTTICSNDSVQFTLSTSGSIASLQWRLNGNNITGATSANYYANTSGDYDVTVLASGGGCSYTSNSVKITVNLAPSPVLSAASTTICQGDSVKLNLAIIGNLSSAIWNKDGGAISGATGNSYYAKLTGNYTVHATNTNGCAQNSNGISITVNPSPVAVISYAKPALSVTNVAGNTYQLYLNGTPISSAMSSTYTATANGNYTVMVTTSAGCKATSAIYKVTDITGINIALSNSNIQIYPNPSDGLYIYQTIHQGLQLL